jgi:hypothetical protein
MTPHCANDLMHTVFSSRCSPSEALLQLQQPSAASTFAHKLATWFSCEAGRWLVSPPPSSLFRESYEPAAKTDQAQTTSKLNTDASPLPAFSAPLKSHAHKLLPMASEKARPAKRVFPTPVKVSGNATACCASDIAGSHAISSCLCSCPCAHLSALRPRGTGGCAAELYADKLPKVCLAARRPEAVPLLAADTGVYTRADAETGRRVSGVHPSPLGSHAAASTTSRSASFSSMEVSPPCQPKPACCIPGSAIHGVAASMKSSVDTAHDSLFMECCSAPRIARLPIQGDAVLSPGDDEAAFLCDIAVLSSRAGNDPFLLADVPTDHFDVSSQVCGRSQLSTLYAWRKDLFPFRHLLKPLHVAC